MSKKYKTVCFDMDGTLIRNTNSVEYLCQLSNKAQDVKEIEDKEKRDEISWIKADYLKARLFKGLEVREVSKNFGKNIKIIDNLEIVLNELKSRGIKVMLVTAGPIQVAEELNKLYKFDKIYGSDYEVINGKYTGLIKNHLGDNGKLDSVREFCNENSINLYEVVSIGDSASDLKVFEKVGKSIAINYSKSVIGKANKYILTNDLKDVLKFILGD